MAVTEGSEGTDITASYDQGIEFRVPYSFVGSEMTKQEEKAVVEALHGDSLTMGPRTTEFEQKFAEYCGVKHAVSATNCTSAMQLATQLFDIRPGDEVIVTPVTFIATSLVVLREGGRPIFADIDPRTYNIDPSNIESLVTDKTKAVYVVHYGGQMVDMDPIMEVAKRYNLKVLEDCAHAPGAEYKGRKAGTIGDIGAFSFHSLKNLTTAEGGMLTTNSDELAEKAAMLHCMNMRGWEREEWIDQGWIDPSDVEDRDYWIPAHFSVEDVDGQWGGNYRMNELQAAMGLAQLGRLQENTARRIKIVRQVNDGLKGVKGIKGVYEAEEYDHRHVYHLYTLLVVPEELGATRNQFMRVLAFEEGVQGILHYQPTYHFPGLVKFGITGNCPIAERFFYKQELNLPMYPQLTDEQVEIMIEGIISAADKVRDGKYVSPHGTQ